MTGFIIFYKRKSGESYITQYPDSAQAVNYRFLREAESSDPDTEVAHNSAPSLASVKNPIPSISWESFTSPTIRTG